MTSPKVKKIQIWPISTFSDDAVRTSETRRKVREKVFDSSFNALLTSFLLFRGQANGLASCKVKIADFHGNRFSAVTRVRNMAEKRFAHHRVRLIKTHRMMYNCIV